MNKLIVMAFLAGLLSSFVGGTLGVIASSGYNAERSERVFVYGTLTNPLYRTYACLCLVESKAATLDGYVKTVRNIIPAENSVVRGAVIRVSTNELARLDNYENVPEQYVREWVVLADNSPAWVYVKTEPAE